MEKRRMLTGIKEIQGFVGRSWNTIRMWIAKKDFPAKKIDGVWESDTELIIEWRRKQITD